MMLPTSIRLSITVLYLLLIIPSGSVAAQPPHKVPNGLSAAQYFDLGKQYKAAGWPEQARDALNRSVEADPQGIGSKARTYLNAYIPRHQVPDAAVRKNVMGHNQMARGDQAGAIRTFQECIERFPDFEWPYGNIGFIYTQQGRTREARDIIQQALAINPSYLNGWLHLAEANLRDGDVEGARDAARKALELDPDSEPAKFLLDERFPPPRQRQDIALMSSRMRYGVMIAVLLAGGVLLPFLIRLVVLGSTRNRARGNLERLAQFLNVSVQWASFFTALGVDGSYKGRRITAKVSYGETGTFPISIYPKHFPKKQPFFMLDYPSVTENTYRMGDKITHRMGWRTNAAAFSKEWGPGDFISILDELTRAAEHVESQSTPYSGKETR